MLLFLILVGVTTQQTPPFQTPLSVNVTESGCSYIERFFLQFEYGLVTAAGRYTGSYYEIVGPQYYEFEPLNILEAAKPDKTSVKYHIQSIRLYYPAENNIEVPEDQAGQNTAELRIVAIESNMTATDPKNRLVATVSIFFSDGQREEEGKLNLFHLPDGIPILRPFTQISNTPTQTVQTFEINYNLVFEPIIKNFHQYVGFDAKDDLDNKFIAYFNKKKFYVPPSFLSRFARNPTPKASSRIQENTPAKTSFDQHIVKICFGTTDETILRQNYALWFWIIVLIVWWICLVCSEDNTEEVFMDEFLDNKLTMIPIYSMYKVANEHFFSKLSRFTGFICYFSWQILVLSVMYGQLVGKMDQYNVTDVIILWYAIVAILVSIPIGYVFGVMQFNFRELNKHKMLLETDYKKITNKHTQEAITLQKAIRDDEDRQYTYWFTYYSIAFLFFICACPLSIWQMSLVTRVESDYWIATIFLMLFLDHIVLDTILPFIPVTKSLLKYRGYYYDGELAKVWKHLEEQ